MRVPHPKELSWREVRPGSHRFTPNVDQIAASAWRHVPSQNGARSGWEFDVSRAFSAKLGKWAVGWCWGVGEATLPGGVVRSWCCPKHSYTNHDDTVRLCAQALVEWRGWLEELAALFATLKPASAEAVGPAATSVLMAVAQRTESQDVWHRHAVQVLGWFLEACGVDAKKSAHIATTTLEDKLENWAEPDDETLEEIDAAFAKAAAPALHLK